MDLYSWPRSAVRQIFAGVSVTQLTEMVTVAGKSICPIFLTMLYLFRELNSFRQSVILQKENLSTHQTQS